MRYTNMQPQPPTNVDISQKGSENDVCSTVLWQTDFNYHRSDEGLYISFNMQVLYSSSQRFQ